MKIAIIGANGRLGAALGREYTRDFEVTSFGRSQLDLGQLDRVRSALAAIKFELVINCAALTNVDYCESHREEALLVNAEAPRLLAEIANEKSAKLVHVSTDYVFDGKKTAPYTEEDKAIPLSVYGESKLEGERRVLDVSSQHLVVRLSWVFGPDKPSFIDQSFSVLAKTKRSPLWPINFLRLVTPSMSRVGCVWPSIKMQMGFCIWLTTAAAAGRSGPNMQSMFAVTSEFR